MIDRTKFVGGSEVAALFGQHPYLTRFTLWHRKAGNLPEPDLSAEPRVQAGIWLEPAVAAWAADRERWSVEKNSRVLLHPTVQGFGGTPDYFIAGDAATAGILEVKTTDALMAARWEDDEPPLFWQLQLQSYLGLTGQSWGAIAALIGGNDLQIFTYDARPAVFAKLCAAVAEFWSSIDEGREPPPEWAADAETIAALHARAIKDKVLDLSTDNRIPALIGEYEAAQADEKAAGERKSAARAEMLHKIGDAAKVVCGAYTISAGEVVAQPDRIITSEMVGQVIKGRASYRSLRIT